MKKHKDLKQGVGFSITATTLEQIDAWVIKLQSKKRASKINRGHVLAMIVGALQSVGWQPGMQVVISAVSVDAESVVTTLRPRVIQTIATPQGRQTK
jgi:hypothetical protein